MRLGDDPTPSGFRAHPLTFQTTQVMSAAILRPTTQIQTTHRHLSCFSQTPELGLSYQAVTLWLLFGGSAHSSLHSSRHISQVTIRGKPRRTPEWQQGTHNTSDDPGSEQERVPHKAQKEREPRHLDIKPPLQRSNRSHPPKEQGQVAKHKMYSRP